MIPQKRLQVFISSTFTDLREERQAVVEAVLKAGHIPAGMELFSAGDESQMNIIKKWIDESDVYMLIVGGRYGSIEEKSGKSYTHLEYDYAIEKGKPHFAVMINDACLEARVKDKGTSFMEKDEPQKFKAFKSELQKSKMVEFWEDEKDIKLTVLNKLLEYSHQDDLVGWVKGSYAINGGEIAEQMAKLMKENEELRQKLSGEGNGSSNILSFAEQYQFLKKQILEPKDFNRDYYLVFLELIKIWEPTELPTLLHVVWYMQWNEDRTRILGPKIVELFFKNGLYDREKSSNQFTFPNYYLSPIGKAFVQRLILTNQYPEAAKFVYPYNPFAEKK